MNFLRRKRAENLKISLLVAILTVIEGQAICFGYSATARSSISIAGY
jgi:hypothetical protein